MVGVESETEAKPQPKTNEPTGSPATRKKKPMLGFDVSFDPEDRARVSSNKKDFYKAQKDRIDVVSFVSFTLLDDLVVKEAMAKAQNRILTEDDIDNLRKKWLAAESKKRGKPITLLDRCGDFSRPKIGHYTQYYNEALKIMAVRAPESSSSDDDRIWNRLGEPRPQLTTVLLVYPTNRDGEVDPAEALSKYRIMPWKFGQGMYQKLAKLDGTAKKISQSRLGQHDITFECKDTQYQNIDPNLGGKAIWRTFPLDVQEKIVAEAYKIATNEKIMVPGTVMTTEQLAEKLGIRPSGNTVSFGGNNTSSSSSSEEDDDDSDDMIAALLERILLLPMLTLGLDPSLTGFGWAIHDDTAEGASRLVSSGLWVTSPKEVFVKRYRRLRTLLTKLLLENPEVLTVGVESPPFGEQFSEGLYALFTHVNEAVYLARRDVVHFDPGTVKMLAKIDPSLRPGKMFKSDMVEMARLDTGISRWNHNVADAYLIAIYGARFWRYLRQDIGIDQLTPSEYKAFARTHTFQKGLKKGVTVKMGAVYKEGRRFFEFSKIPPGEDE